MVHFSRDNRRREGYRVDLTKLTLGDRIVAGTGLALAIDLLFLPWHNIDIEIFSVSRTAIQSPNRVWGVFALLLTMAMVAAVAVNRFTSTQLPELPVPWTQAMFFAGIAVDALLVLKLLMETDFLGFGAFLGILLAAGLAYGAFLMGKESGPAEAGAGDSHRI